MNERFQSIDERLRTLESRVSHVEVRMATSNERLDSIDAAVRSVDRRVSLVEDWWPDVSAKVALPERAVAADAISCRHVSRAPDHARVFRSVVARSRNGSARRRLIQVRRQPRLIQLWTVLGKLVDSTQATLRLRRTMQLELTAVFREDPDGGYVAFVEELPGANTQGETLDEARSNLREAVRLVIEANRALAAEDMAGIKVIREPFLLTA